MSELCSSNSHFSTLIISDLILLCSFILSHPLYFSYILFFSPYLIKLISFLSPLFLTTSLLFLAFLVHTQSSQIHFTSILQILQLKKDFYFPNEEDDDDLGIYEILFAPPSMAAVTDNENENENPSEILDQTPEKDHILEPNPILGSDKEAPIIEKFDENKVSKCEAAPAAMEEKRLENFLKILDEFERLANPNVDEKSAKKKQEPSRSAKSDKVVEKKQNSLLINGSEAPCNYYNQINNNAATTKEALPIPTMARSHSQRIMKAVEDDRDSLSTYGSMRREREWKRTLACKLFEERHNAGAGSGGEGMDSLWEAYETDSSRAGGKRRSERVGRREKGTGVGEREREMEEDDVVGGQLCCLQALKMSAGKMNLGVGRPNLVKISKAIKGIGWLHNLTKNSKKVHNNGDHRF